MPPSDFLNSDKKTLLERFQNMAPYERNRLFVGLLAAVAFVVVLLVWFRVLPGRAPESGPIQVRESVTLQLWDVFDNKQAYDPLIAEYRRLNPYVNIKYSRREFDPYRQEVTEAFAEGRGPDIYVMHNTWLPLEQNRISPLNKTFDPLNPDDNSATILGRFPDVVRFDFTREGENEEPIIYALPLAIDTLALYYNRTYFNSENILEPPSTWEEFIDDVEKLRRVDSNGDVLLAGAAMGGGLNINRSTDILSLLMLQSGVAMNNDLLSRVTFSSAVEFDETEQPDIYSSFFHRDTTSRGQEALEFYTSFADSESENYTWDAEGPYSIDAFVGADAAMMFNYSFHRATIRRKAPHLDFTVAPVPQPTDRFDRVNYANYWGLTVSKHSENPKVAWDFIRFMLQEQNARIYLAKTERPPSLKVLIKDYENDPEMSVFANQLLSARSWAQGDSPETELILVDLIEGVLTGTTNISTLLRDAENKINRRFFELESSRL